MAVKRGLGKSFESLIPTEVIEEEFDITADVDEQVSDLRNIRIDKIVRDEEQPRQEFDAESLELLADNIKEHGVLQPIVVTPHGDKFQIVAGERRWRASQLAGKKTIPTIVRTLDGQRRLELALIENAQREDLKPLEFATALAKMRDQFNMSLQDISKRIGKSFGYISNHLRMLQLPEFALEAALAGNLTEGHARQVLALEGDEKAQRYLLDKIVNDAWSVRKAEQYVKGYKRGGKGSQRQAAKFAVQKSNKFTMALGKRLGMQVRQKLGVKGGEIIIKYKDDADLKRLEKLL
jgi:ParB family chromosome partitioning protein